MPDWGLSKEQRDTEPWGLPPEVLAPGKVITDPVHGDIHLNRLEMALVDTHALQRLRRVRQLGTTHLVYPGATHSRFSHSLGAVRVAQRLLDQILSQREGLHAVPDLFGQWQETTRREDFNKSCAEAVVLARLGGLLHDLCHVPIGHSVEDDLEILVPHDENERRFESLWFGMRDRIRKNFKRGALPEDSPDLADKVDAILFEAGSRLFTQLKPLIVSKRRDPDTGTAVELLPPQEMQYPFVADLVGNTICADLLDYLLRDHQFTGLPAEIGNRFISAFFVVPRGRGPLSRRMALNIQRHQHERPDIVSELLKALRYRYELSERALYHHAKLCADAMLGEALERWEGALWLQAAAEDLDQIPGHEKPLKLSDTYELRKLLERENEARSSELREEVSRKLEVEFIAHGDDGLLERMRSLEGEEVRPGATAKPARRLLRQSAELADALLDRDFFRIAGRVGYKDASASTLVDAFGKAAERDRLERSAERFAELGGADIDDRTKPRVVLWLPKPDMRLKLARVLVQHQTSVGPFVEYEESRSRRGSDIYAAHKRLWSCFVFVHRDVEDEQAKIVTTFLAGEMGARWERHQEFGPRTEEWSARLAIREELRDERPDEDRVREVLRGMKLVAARGDVNFSALRRRVRAAAEN